jgi:hypothetical protein
MTTIRAFAVLLLFASPVYAARHFNVSVPAYVSVGALFDVTVTAAGEANETLTDYIGTVHFTSTASNDELPPDTTFVASDAGIRTFQLRLAPPYGNRTITVTDVDDSSMAGNATVNGHFVNLHFNVDMARTATVGTPLDVFLQVAFVPEESSVSGYTGTVHFSSNIAATLPPDYTFAGEPATHISVTPLVPGDLIISVTDIDNPQIRVLHPLATTVTCAETTPEHRQLALPSRICAGATALATAPPLGGAAYAWIVENGAITSGQGTDRIAFTAGPAGAVSIQVTRSADCAAVIADGSIAITEAPTASLQDSMFACAGTAVEIPVTLTGTPPFTIVWSDGFVQNDIDSTSTTRTILADTTDTLRIDSISDASCNAARSAAALFLLVDRRPLITQQPRNATLRAGERANLSVLTSPPGFPQFEWFEGEVGDETHRVGEGMQFRSLPVPQSTKFWVKVQNDCFVVRSDAAVITIGAEKRRSVR